jgi:uncharacterized protein with von Willebrand factor type A (vWA) domain
VYGRLYKTERFDDPVPLAEVMRQCDARYKLVFVGDALMAPYELLAASPLAPGDPPTAGIHWLARLREHFPHAVWLNPESPREWKGNTIEVVRGVVPMFHLTVEGITEAVTELMKRR